jgi:hypothetical protein
MVMVMAMMAMMVAVVTMVMMIVIVMVNYYGQHLQQGHAYLFCMAVAIVEDVVLGDTVSEVRTTTKYM